MDPYKQVQTEENQGIPLPSEPEPKQQQLAPVPAGFSDKEELIEEYKLLITYKQNQQKLETLLEIEKDKQTIEELESMKGELQSAVAQQEEKIKDTQNNEVFQYNTEVYSEKYVGRICKGYYEKENKWFHALIGQVNEDEQMVSIQYIGFKDIIESHSIFLKLLDTPDPDSFLASTQCECIYSDNGKYYPCEIDKVLEDGKYVVKYKAYNTKETVSLYYLRESKKVQSNKNQNKKRTFDDLSEFKVPENLHILPNDTEQTKLTKKKKIKSLKQQFKSAVIEKDSGDRQNKWTQFQNKKKPKFGKDKGSIFQTSDRVDSKVGVMNSGKGMSNFTIKDRLLLEDNSHLSRQF